LRFFIGGGIKLTILSQTETAPLPTQKRPAWASETRRL